MHLDVVKAFFEVGGQECPSGILTHLLECGDKGTDEYLTFLLAHTEGEVQLLVREILVKRNPWLNLVPIPLATLPNSLKKDGEGAVWDEISRAIDSVINVEKGNLHTYDPFLEIPGLHYLLTDSLRQHGYETLAVQMAEKVNLGQEFSRRELQFAPTYRCNLSCSYCYAKDWHQKFNGDTPLTRLPVLLDWMKRQDLDILSLAGGEPTLYPHFGELCSLCRTYGISMNLASNLLYSKTVAGLLHKGLFNLVTAHYDQSLLHDERRHNTFLKNLRAIREKDIPVRFRYNLTSSSTFEEWETIFRILRSVGMDEINFAPTFLNYDSNNSLSVNMGGAKENTISTMIAFCDMAQERNVKLYLCKPVALCWFPEQKRNEYLVNNTLRNSCVAPASKCSRNVTVNPDFSTFPCTALAKNGPEITTFDSMEEIGKHFESYIMTLAQKPFLADCADCFFYYTGFCLGVCLVEKANVT